MPFADIQTFMAIGAHCDDIDLRCAGTFARLTREGKRGCWVVMAQNDYTGAHFSVANSAEALATQHHETTQASTRIGAARVEWLGFKSYYFSTPEPKGRIYPAFDSYLALLEEMSPAIFRGLPPVANADRFPVCRDRLTRLLDEWMPRVVFTHSPDDRHPDHYAVARFIELVISERQARGEAIDLYFWEPGSWGPIAGFAPNCFVELTGDDIASKQAAIDCYRSQFPSGLVGTFAADRARAYGQLIGVEYAEPFRQASGASANPWAGPPDFVQALPEDRRLYRS